MIDREDVVFDAVSAALREAIPGVFVIGTDLTDTPPQFPAVSIVQTDNTVNQRHSTFDCVENAASETYTFNAYSNLESQRDAKRQVKHITDIIDSVMCDLHYPRVFCQFVLNADAKITRRVARYTKTNVTMEV